MQLQSLCFFILACATVSQACALEAIDTDGPDFVDSSEVVGNGRFLIEQDAVTEREGRNAEPSRTVSTPTLLRYGVGETVELRLQADTYIRKTGVNRGLGSGVEGYGDLGVGLKWHTHDRREAENRPAVSWILQLDTPSGSKDFRGHGTRPSLRSVITWDLPQQISLALMPGLTGDSRADGHRYTSGMFGINFGKRFTERFRMFVESAYSQLARAENGGVVAAWDIGAVYLLTNDWQLGSRFAAAANRNSPGSMFLIEVAGRF